MGTSLVNTEEVGYNAYYSFIYFWHGFFSFLIMLSYFCGEGPFGKCQWITMIIYNCFNMISYFICGCISIGNFNVSAIPAYIILPLCFGETIFSYDAFHLLTEVLRLKEVTKVSVALVSGHL